MQSVSDAVPLRVDQGTKGAAAVGGLGYVLASLAIWGWLHGGLNGLAGALFTGQVGPWLVYAFGGGALLGAVLAVSVVRYRLLVPVAVVAAPLGVATFQTWQAARGPAVVLPGTPYDLFLVGWPVALALAVATGAVERRVRDRFGSESAAGR